MSTGEKYSTLPENADKILFAEDLMNHVLFELDLSLLSSGIADYRALVYNAFGPEVRLATSYAQYCAEEKTWEHFEIFLKNNKINIGYFEKYVAFLKSKIGAFAPTETKAHKFLTFCVRISMMAGKFYNHGILDARALAVEHIVNMIKEFDMIEEGGWEALNTASTCRAKFYARVYLTSERDVKSDSLDNSPDREGEENLDDDLEESSDEEFRKVFIDSCSSSPEEPVPLRSGSKRVEETYDGKAGNIVTSLDNAPDSASAGSSIVKNSEVFFHSSQGTSKKDDSPIQNENPSCSYWKDSKFDTKNFKTHVQIADGIDKFDTRSAVGRSAILSSNANELKKSDSAQHLKISNSDNLNNESMNKSSTEEVQTSVAKSGRRKKSVPKRRDELDSNRWNLAPIER